MSSFSAASSISEERLVRARSNLVSRNIARDDAFQMNTGYLKVDKLVINCHQMHLAAHVAASGLREHSRIGVLSIDDAKAIPNASKTGRKESEPHLRPYRGHAQQPDIRWIASSRKKVSSAPSGRYVHIYNRVISDYTVIFATIGASTSDASIARRIVKSFGLSPSGCSSASPSGDFIDLTCEASPGKACKAYRFRILDGGPFDICIGPELAASQPHNWQTQS